MDYLPFLRYGLTEPLVKQGGEGVKDVISIMDTYDIIKDDFDNIMEITKFPNSRDPLSKLESKVRLQECFKLFGQTGQGKQCRPRSDCSS